jgi:predicted dehydrogenase
MNTAIIGCGLIANMHAQAILSLGHQISIAVDHNHTKAEAFAKQYGIEKSSDAFNSCLSDNIDVVHICTPPALHHEMVKTALLAGKHVICEKPLVLENDQAQELIQLAEENKLVHAVNFNVRFYDACKEAKSIIQSNEFGKQLIIHGSYQQEFHIPPAEASWRYQPELAGPMRAVTEIGSHWFDIARYLTGLEIEKVSANFANFSPYRSIENNMLYRAPCENESSFKVNSEDAAVISMQLSNGAIGSVVLSEISHGRSNALSIEIVGENKSIWWNSEMPNQLNQASKSKGVTGTQFAFSGAYPETFVSFIKEVYRHIGNSQDTPNHYPTFRDGLINTAICNAVYESAMNDAAWVTIPNLTGE